MKKRNNKVIVLIVVAVLFAVSLLIFILNYSKDNSSFSILEKKWINDNTSNVLDISVYNDVPVYGKSGKGVIFDLLDDFTTTYGINFNKISYSVDSSSNLNKNAFRVLNNNESLTNKDILLYEDNYVLVSTEEEVINNINLMFNRIMDDDIGGASYKESHQMVYGNLMYKGEGDNKENNNFEVYSYLNDTSFKKEEVEAFIIAGDIKKKVEEGYLAFGKDTNGIRKIKYSDFAILLDSSKYFELYKKILEYNGVPTIINKSINLTDGEVITIIKNIISFIIKLKSNIIDNEFKKLFISLGRSFLFNIDDDTLFDYFLNNNYKDSDIYKISYEITKKLDTISLDEIIDIITYSYDFNNKLFLLGDYSSNVLRIEKLKEITSNLTNLDYDIYSYQEYLEDIINNNLKIEFTLNDNGDDTVKIMTIHASKGLEFNICYYGGLYSKFNNEMDRK